MAVAAVLLYHADRLEGGWLGVDLFFVLSGYLITALLITGWKAEDRVALGSFWARRARRLAPALVLTVIGVSLYAVTIGQAVELHGIRNDGLATLFEVANWRTIATGGDYWATNQFLPSPFRHTWSLAVEEQLYLLWPLAVAGLLRWRRSPAGVLAIALAGAAASAALMVVGHSRGWSATRLYFGTDTRASAVLLGAALAALRVVLGPRRWAAARRVRQVLGTVAAVALGFAWFTVDGATDLPYQGVLPLAGLGGALVIAAVADRRHRGPLGEVLAVGPLTHLGRISYGVYLYHWPLYLVLTPTRTGLDGWALVAVRVAVTLVVAELSHRFLEEPIRRGRMLTGRQGRAALPAGVALAVMALLGASVGAVAPYRMVATDEVATSSVPGAPLLMLAGDSVPLVLGWSMIEQVDELAVSVADRGQPGCHLLASVGDIRGVEGNVREDVSDCSEEGRYRQEVERLRPDVVAVMFGEFPNESLRLDGDWVMPCQPAYLEALRSRLDALVDDLSVTGAPVVLLTAPGTDLSWVVEKVPDGMDERVACTNQVLVDLAAEREGVGLVDLASFICPPGQACIEKVDGVDLRPDFLHISGAGAEYVNRWLVPEILRASEGS